MPARESQRQTLEILLVEDNPGDVRLLQEAFKEINFTGRLHVVRDGEAAMAFLQQQGSFRDSPRPSFVLLDLNLPRKDGREVLAEVKRQKDLRRIPIFILSTSTGWEDVCNAYDLHANCYIPKPMDLGALIQIVRQLQKFWLGTAVLPA